MSNDVSASVVAVFGSSQTHPDDPDYIEAMRCGQLLAQAGFHVATGGYGGLMEAVSRGAATAGGTVIAVTAPDLFPMRSGANEWVHIESPQPTISLRIGQLIDNSVATIALPGSIGTLTELMVAWNASHVEVLGDRMPRPVVTVGDRWTRIIPLIAAEVSGMGELVVHAPTVDAAVETVIAACMQ